jgi:hypothetical protein
MLAAAEVALRAIDGHRFDSWTLQPRGDRAHDSSGKWHTAEEVASLAAQVPLAPGVDREWFTLQIPRPPKRSVDPDLAARARRYADLPLQATYEWNQRYVEHTLCSDARRRQAVFDKLVDIYTFESHAAAAFPTFRFHRNASYPSGLQTNAYGWRGSQVPLDKPPRTIRIGFIGASTTIGGHGEPFSYPELVEVWLNRWAAARDRGLRFEVLNTAREGLDTSSMRFIVRDELAALEPDLVVFYEGSNHFWPADFISDTLPPRPLGQVADEPGVLARHSALAARLRNLFFRGHIAGQEPDKPALEVRWPRDLSETTPDLMDPRLPTNLAGVISHFDEIRETLQTIGARFVLTTFTWLVSDGLQLDPRRDAGIYRYLNEAFWPFTYAHMRRVIDFQNVVYRRYAEQHGLEFIEYDARFPKDPRLFLDAIHLTNAGIRLQAWIMLQGLVPIVERQIASGAWPLGDRVPLSVHPAFSGARRLMPIAALASSCTEQN